MQGRTALRALGVAAGMAAVYGAAVAALRPAWNRWGATDDEVTGPLPADEYFAGRPPTSTRAVTIDAPVEQVWQWLVQIGQDRGGFYSYDWLERAIGDRVYNTDEIHPEWQSLAAGELVRSVQDGYLGTSLEDVGWKVLAVQPKRFIALENWGQFVVEPLDATRTRLIVRSQGGEIANPVLRLLWSLFGDPAHFIMERGMLLGIKARAERIQGEEATPAAELRQEQPAAA